MPVLVLKLSSHSSLMERVRMSSENPWEFYSDGLTIPSAGYNGKDGRTSREENGVAESVYKVIELVGTSPDSWEKAAKAAIGRAAQSLQDLRIAEVSKLDMQLEDGEVLAFRARVKVSFKYHEGD